MASVIPASTVAKKPAAPSKPHEAPGVKDGMARWIALTPLLGVTVFSKFAFNLGTTEILLGVPLILGSFAIGFFFGRLRFTTQTLIAYVGMMAVLLAIQFAVSVSASFGSVLLLASIHLCYTVSLSSELKAVDTIQFFQKLAEILAFLAIAQYALQFVAGIDYAFPIEHFAPDSLVTHSYNDLNALGYQVKIFKANGVFMPEASMLSQLLAVAVTVELVRYRRLSRLALFAAALYVSYSGTGLVILAVVLPIVVLLYKRYELFIIGGLLLAAAGIFAEPLHLDVFLGRATEFSDTHSSGFVRFVGAFYLFEKVMWHDTLRTLFGFGSGTFNELVRVNGIATYPVEEMSWTKIMFEFGVVGFVVYFGFLYYCILRTAQPLPIRLALVVLTLLNGILNPWAHGMILSLLVWPEGALEKARDAAPIPPKSTPASAVGEGA